MTPERFVPIFRDLTCIIVGGGGIAHQTLFASSPNAYLLGACVTLLATPGAVGLWSLRRDGGQATTEPSSPSPPSSPQPVSPPSAPSAAGGGGEP